MCLCILMKKTVKRPKNKMEIFLAKKYSETQNIGYFPIIIFLT